MSMSLSVVGVFAVSMVLCGACEIQKDAGANVVPLEMSKPAHREGKALDMKKGSHILHVSRNDWGGWIVSAPAGINYGDPANGGISEARYAEGAAVRLCVSNTHPLPFDIAWTGDCSGTSRCIDVVMDGDKACRLALTPR